MIFNCKSTHSWPVSDTYTTSLSFSSLSRECVEFDFDKMMVNSPLLSCFIINRNTKTKWWQHQQQQRETTRKKKIQSLQVLYNQSRGNTQSPSSCHLADVVSLSLLFLKSFRLRWKCKRCVRYCMCAWVSEWVSKQTSGKQGPHLSSSPLARILCMFVYMLPLKSIAF